MKIYNTTYSALAPAEIEMTDKNVFVASDIHQVTRPLETGTESCYEFTLTVYTKDEYIMKLTQQNTELADELEATKIILGVE